VEIDEKGTRFSEEIDVNEKGDTAVFRVPSHNNIDGADFYHDFKMVSFSFSFCQFNKQKAKFSLCTTQETRRCNRDGMNKILKIISNINLTLGFLL